MSTIEVRPVRSQKDMMQFIKLPWSIYKGNQTWVPPLIMDQKVLMSPERNPFFQHAQAEYFLAYANGKAVGRIAGIYDRLYIDFQNENIGFFGFYESINDQAVADALFEAAILWLKGKGVVEAHGPTNPGTNDVMGTLVDAFDMPPVVMMPYNHDYYPTLFEQAGFAKAKDLLAYWLDESLMNIGRLDRMVELLKKRHKLTLRPINLKKLDEEIDLVREIYNDAWEKNWHFVPWTDEEITHLGKELKPVADPELVLFAYKDDEPVGFSLSLPDVHQALIHVRSGRLFPFGLLKLLYHQRHISQVRVLAMGIRHKYRGLGVDALFYHRTFRYAEAKGMQRGECSWILEDNHSMKAAMERMGGRVYKTYRVYAREID